MWRFGACWKKGRCRMTAIRRGRVRHLALFAVAAGMVFGFALGSFGLLPVPEITFRWKIPVVRASQYAPGVSLSPGEEVVLIYLGSSTCAWSNVPELPSEVRRLKVLLQARAQNEGKRFATVGIARDWLTKDGIDHLNKFGSFDEIMTGRSWANHGTQHYIYGEGDMAGPRSTPQVIVISRKLESHEGRPSISDERVILRRTGVDAISKWIAAGAPLSFGGD